MPALAVHEPGPHAEQDAEPGAAAQPAEQATQDEELVPPVLGLAVPPGQMVQLLAPAVAKVPIGHTGHIGVGDSDINAPDAALHTVVTLVKFMDEPALHV